jgi:galactofuranosylgalactofuranosylrhamnosyl-N-acetylglucosaminyl-diphospho-decaprenol beta-1,5/1,6-galactofuranosyltransferase
MRTLQRVILPVDQDPDLVTLYVSDQPGKGADSGAAQMKGRRGMTIPSGNRTSFCSYFNAFAAGYWRRWSIVDEIHLRIRLRGSGTVVVYRSDAAAHRMRVKAIPVGVHAGETKQAPVAATIAGKPAKQQKRVKPPVQELDIVLPLKPFLDGGWYWFEIIADDESVVLEEAEWCAATDRRQGTTSIGITTFNRSKFCVELLAALGDSPEALEVIDEVFVVDQGTDRVEDHPDFVAAQAALDGKLRIITQGNLGGSGGFSRAMAETLRSDRSDYVLLLDDDIALAEPESIVRLVAFGDLARTPTIVGGHMFDLLDRPVLHVYGDTVAPYRWWTEAAPNTHLMHNFAHHALAHTHWMHRRADSDFNGWWMCLIPTEVIRKIGLSLPVFIKWDDVEYGLRARKAGFPTVSLPGAGVWHMPWHAKDTATDWQMYFQERNRIITALLHSPYERGGNMIKESLFITIKHALAMQYSTAELMLLAIQDVFEGPSHLHPSMATKVGEIRALRACFTDADAKGDLDAFPPTRRRPPKRGRATPPVPEGTKGLLRAAAKGAFRQLRPVDKLAKIHPQSVVPYVDQRWWLLTKFDSVLVSSAEGTTVSWYRRDRERFASLIARATRLHAELLRRWPELVKEYQTGIPELVTPEAWQETFDADGAAQR